MLEEIKKTAAFIDAATSSFAPEVGIILGTGLGGFADKIDTAFAIEYKDIPGFPVSTVEGHKGRMIFGTVEGRKVVAMQGRFHYYEGYTMQQVTFPVRVMQQLGIKYLFVSNASGGINTSFRVGDLMVITDHINLMPNPLIGRNIAELGPRFPDMHNCYDKALIAKATAIAEEENIKLQYGVYVGGTGPTFETQAEYRYFKNIGGDADFGRIAAQTAKHVIRQGIREAERSQQLSEIQSRAHDIVQATVTRVDPEKGIVALDLGKGGEAILPRNEQVPGEVYTEGQMLQVYIVDVVASERGPRVMISRTHPGLVKRLFELEVPEIYDGTVEVKAISREAGARTKMAVWSKDANVNPVSACIGPHGDRVAAVVEKLGGEKIDIVKWSEDISEFISAALSPAKVVKVELLPGETRSCRVTVPDQQLSLAIGNKGQNARLCARLTGYNIDIRPESGYYGEEEPKAAEAEKTEDTAAE